jgi:hypothetical protein
MAEFPAANRFAGCSVRGARPRWPRAMRSSPARRHLRDEPCRVESGQTGLGRYAHRQTARMTLSGGCLSAEYDRVGQASAVTLAVRGPTADAFPPRQLDKLCRQRHGTLGPCPLLLRLVPGEPGLLKPGSDATGRAAGAQRFRRFGNNGKADGRPLGGEGFPGSPGLPPASDRL